MDLKERNIMGKKIEAARQRVAAMGGGAGERKKPLCWNKPFESEEEPSTPGKKTDIAEILAKARQRVIKRCMSCSQRGKCEHSHYRISKTKENE